MLTKNQNRLIRRRRHLRAAVETCEPRRLLASVSGTVFNDADRDGVRDSGEAGRAGVTVFADRNYDGVMQSTELRAVTDANGFYRVSGIVADNTSTGIRLSGVAASSITAPAGGGHSARFASDYEATGRNFGVATTTTPPPAATGTIAGRVVNDANYNGVADTGEGGLANARVYVDANFNNAFDAGEASALTNGTGAYSLTLPTGEVYPLRASLIGSGLDPAAYDQSFPTDSGGTPRVYLPPSGSVAGVNFGFASNGSAGSTAIVTGLIYNDLDRDGVKDAGEAGVANVNVYADLDYDGAKDANEPIVASDSTGNYTLTGIPLSNNSIAIRAIAPSGATFTAPSNGIHSGRFGAAVRYAGRNFGLVLPTTPPPAANGTVAGRVVFDANSDGGVGPGESGLTGVRVYADANRNGAYDAGEASTFTDASGAYSLALPGGAEYSLRATLAGSPYTPADYRQSLPAGDAARVVVAAGQTLNNILFAFAPATPASATATVTGTVYTDADRDGVIDPGEGGVAGVTVYADLNVNGIRESYEPLTTTDANGFYSLTGIPLRNESIAIRALAPAGRTFVGPTNGVLYGRFSGEFTYAGRIFGLAPTTTPTTGTADLRPFFDADADGQLDAGENGPADATVWADLNANGLRESNEPLLAISSTTNGVPTYSVGGLAPGTYRLALRRAGDADLYADYAANVTVTAGQTATAMLAVPTTSSLGGIVYRDLDGDGTKDAGEAGTAGVVVFADYDFDGVRDSNEPQTTTVSDGSYKLYGIRSDNVAFRITAIVPGAASFTQPTAGYYQARFDRAYDLAPQGGRDFGYSTSTASVSGTVYADANGNGVRDAGEAGLPVDEYYNFGVFADLNGNANRDAGEPTAYTDAQGNYTLTGIPRTGSVTVRYFSSPRYATTPASPNGYGYTFFATTPNATNANFGVDAAVVTGNVFLDADRDGVRDTGENGAGGAVAYADVDGDGEFAFSPFSNAVYDPWTRVDAQGNFSLLLPRGTYSLGVADLLTPYFGPSGAEIDGAGVYSRTRGFVQTTADGAAAARVNTADLSTIAGRSLGAVGASLVSIYPKPTGLTGGFSYSFDGSLSAQTELALNLASPLTGWVDLDRDGVRDANEPVQNSFRKDQSDGDGYHAYFLVAADGAAFQFGLAKDRAVGARAETLVTGIGSASLPAYYEPTVTPNRSAVVGYIFYDGNRNGIVDGAESREVPYNDFEAQSYVFADYDDDGVADAGEPGGFIQPVFPGEESGTMGVFVMNVDPGRAFTVRVKPKYGLASGEVSRTTLATPRFSVPAGTVRGLLDVGYYVDAAPRTAILSGRVRDDANRNGVIEGTEGGLVGVSVYVDLDDNGFRSSHEPYALTDGNGYYAISTPPGESLIRIEQPTRLEASRGTMADGRPTPRVTFNTGVTFRVATAIDGQQRGGFDFTAVFGGYAVVAPRAPELGPAEKFWLGVGGEAFGWIDVDGDNVRDAGEPAGAYSYAGVTGTFGPNYPVHEFVVPANTPTRLAFANSDAVGSVAIGGLIVNKPVNAADPSPTLLTLPNTEAGVFGKIFRDTDRDGVRDAGELPIDRADGFYADYNGNGIPDFDEPVARVYVDGSDTTGLSGSYYLAVQPNRTFTIRYAHGAAGVPQVQTNAPRLSVAANTIVTGRDIGLVYDVG